MHLVEALSAASGVEPDQPYIRQEFYPIMADKYITFQPFSKYESKNYPFWNDVFKIIGEKLHKNGIVVVQLGAEGEEKIEGTYSCIGKTSINQSAFIIQNGIMHLGVDSFMSHIAGYLKKPVVSLYGNNYVENVQPYWQDKFIGLDGYGNDKPCFSQVDPHHFIHNIAPELIAKKVCNILGITYDFPFQTLWTGDNHIGKRIDNVPNQILDPKTFNVDGYSIRMDLLHEEDVLIKQLHYCPCLVITKNPIKKDLTPFKGLIPEIVYEVNSKDDAEYIEFLHKTGFNYYLISYLSDDKLKDIKLDFMDFRPIIKFSMDKPDFLEKENVENLFVESKKLILSDKKIYNCTSTWRQGKAIPSLNSLQQLNKSFLTEEFYRDVSNLRFFKKI